MPLGEILGAIGGVVGNLFGNAERNKDRQMQLDAAQHGVEWRVKDAERAGIHPLAALGMNPISLSPVAVGDMGGSFAQIGQDVGRAVAAGSTHGQRADSLSRKMAELQVEGAGIDVEIKRQELASMVRRSLGPVSTGTGPIVPAVGANTARGGDIGGQTLPLPFGLRVTTSPTATAEEVERQYGDVIQEVYGGGRLFYDLVQNLAANKDVKAADDWVKRMAAEFFGINPAY